MIHTHFFIFNAFQQRCSLVWDDKGECAIIDPGFYDSQERDQLFDHIENKSLHPVCIMLTHAHFDHISGMVETAEKFDIPIYMSREEKVILEEANVELCRSFGFRIPQGCGKGNGDVCRYIYIKESDIIKVGELDFEVISTPGHTPGGVCFLERKEKILFSGDTLFAGAIGRTDNRWGDYDALIHGILTKLMVLDGSIDVIPGHGPTTTIAREGMTNPFLLPFNEPYQDEY